MHNFRLRSYQFYIIFVFLYMNCSSSFSVFDFRRVKKSEDDIPVPPLLKSAALWGMPELHYRFLLDCHAHYSIMNLISGTSFSVHEQSWITQFMLIVQYFTFIECVYTQKHTHVDIFFKLYFHHKLCP